jgi:endonuclease/exonuclease/phosphatase family metal-dependent hydrolase
MMWNAIQFVAGGSTLIAFIVAAAAAVYRRRLRHEESLVQSAPESERGRVLLARYSAFDIDTDKLTKQQRYNLAISQIRGRADRYKIAAIIIALLGLLLAVVTGFAIAKGSQREILEERVKSRDLLLAEIRTARDDLRAELENERRRTTELLRRNERLADLLTKFTSEYSVQSLPPDQREIVSDAEQTRNAAIAAIEKRIGGRRITLARLKSLHPNRAFSINNTLVFASFNLRNYRSNSSDVTHEAVVSTLRGLDADVIAVQEVSGEAAVERLTAALAEFEYVLGSTNRRQIGGQPVILCRKDRINLHSSQELDFDESIRKPLVAEIEADGLRFLFVNVHLTYGGGQSPRRATLKLLSEWIKAQKTKSIIVAGDFNCRTHAPEMKLLVEIGGNVLTDELPEGATTLMFGTDKVYDHFVFFGDIVQRYIKQSVHVHDFETLLPEVSLEKIRNTISDHSPISVALEIEG